MKRSILLLGKIIPKQQQQLILGGNDVNECGYGTCNGASTCYKPIGGGGTFCSSESQNFVAVAVEEPYGGVQRPRIIKEQ